MKKIFFTPGPSQLYPTVPAHIRNALNVSVMSISHRSDSFHKIFEDAKNELRKLLDIPSAHHIFFLSSATEAMERIIENTVRKKSFHFVNGSFSSLFARVAKELGKEPQIYAAEYGEGFEIDSVKIPKDTELICITHNETSTGVMLPVKEIEALKTKYPHILIALDIVSSVPFPKINFHKIDCVFFSVQKGFGLPSGLGVLIVNPRVLIKSRSLLARKYSIGSFHNFPGLLKYSEKSETPETPNVLGIYLLGKVAGDLNRRGIHAVRENWLKKAEMLYSLSKENTKFTPFVKNHKFRSPTVIVLEVEGGSVDLLMNLRKKGVYIGNGYKDFAGKHIRIANFPAISIRDISKLVMTLHLL